MAGEIREDYSTTLSFSIGDRVGPYIILGQLGVGGSAVVYLARKQRNRLPVRTPCALKIISYHAGNHTRLRTIFENEVRLGGLLLHENTVPVRDFADIGRDGLLLIEMTWVPGCSLAELLAYSHEIGTPLPASVGLSILLDVARGLRYAHEVIDQIEGERTPIIHNDIKPGNILVGRGGAAYLTDFGIARALGSEELGGDAGFRGTYYYAAPEALRHSKSGSSLRQTAEQRSAKYDQSAACRAGIKRDLFGFGCVAFEVVFNERFFSRQFMPKDYRLQDLDDRFIRLNLPPEATLVRDLIYSLLHPDPERRPSSAAQVIFHLQDFVADRKHVESYLSGTELLEHLVELTETIKDPNFFGTLEGECDLNDGWSDKTEAKPTRIMQWRDVEGQRSPVIAPAFRETTSIAVQRARKIVAYLPFPQFVALTVLSVVLPLLSTLFLNPRLTLEVLADDGGITPIHHDLTTESRIRVDDEAEFRDGGEAIFLTAWREHTLRVESASYASRDILIRPFETYPFESKRVFLSSLCVIEFVGSADGDVVSFQGQQHTINSSATLTLEGLNPGMLYEVTLTRADGPIKSIPQVSCKPGRLQRILL